MRLSLSLSLYHVLVLFDEGILTGVTVFQGSRNEASLPVGERSGRYNVTHSLYSFRR
jgi:hypothetical protein